MAGAQKQMMIEQAVAAVASQLEHQLDAQLDRLDHMGEQDLEQIRKARVQDMKRKQEKTKEWLAKGHGEYNEVLSEKEFFDAMKCGEERMICHFYRENWPCKVMDKHMGILAKKHIETRFCKINAEKSPFLVERLKIWMLPTLALIKKEKVEDYIVGFDDFGGKDDFDTDVVAERLGRFEMIDYDFPKPVVPTDAPKVRKGGFHKTASDEDSDFE